MATGEVTIQVKADTKAFDKQIAQVEKELADLEETKRLIDLGMPGGNWDYGELEAKIEKTRNKLIGLRQEKEKINQTGFEKSNTDLSNVGNQVENIIKKVGRWALAVFSVRSAYNFVRQASSTLAQYNEQYGTDLEYIRFALAQMIAPVLEYVVNLARTLLAYINYIANAWFGVNLFANASAKSFEKAKNNIGGATRSAKELQKTLTGFDEMNILNSSSTGGGGGVGGSIPSFDLSNLEDIAIPGWLEWIAQNKDKIINAIRDIALAFLIFKTLQITGILSGIVTVIKNIISSLGLVQGTFFSLGLAGIISGIAIAIYGVIQYIEDPSWENFKTVLYGLELAVAGLATAMLALDATNPLGWIVLAVDAIAVLVTWIVDLVEEDEYLYDAEDRLIEIEEKLKEAREELTNATDKYIRAVDNAEESEKKLKDAQDQTGISIDGLLELMDKENLTYKDLNEQQRKVYKAYIDNKGAQENLTASTEELEKASREEERRLLQKMDALMDATDDYNEYKQAVIEAYEEGSFSAQEAANAIMYAMDDMDETTKQTFTKDLPSAIQDGLNVDRYQSFINKFKNKWNNDFIGGLTKSFGLNIKATASKSTSGFKTGGLITKLASGALINLPGRGVPVSNAIAGEAGTEGIIPLTDSQAMQRLGESIGRYITVNASITNTMNGRIISRQLQQIQNEENFAYNT